MSEEQKQKISRANKGHFTSEEHRRKISEAKKGVKRGPLPEEWRKNIGAAQKGRCATEETREKIKIKRQKYWEKEESHKKASEIKKGENNPAWCGGVSFGPYCPKFNKEFKERVRAYFGHQCVECGHVWQEGEPKLDVHHVNFNKETCCDDTIPLFVPLCHWKCHTKTNHNRIFWQYWFTEMINRLYGGKCYFSKEEYEALMRNKNV